MCRKSCYNQMLDLVSLTFSFSISKVIIKTTVPVLSRKIFDTEKENSDEKQDKVTVKEKTSSCPTCQLML